MLYYVHSASPIEKLVSRKLSLLEDLHEIDFRTVARTGQLPEIATGSVLVYSFLELAFFKDIRSYNTEYKVVQQLAGLCKEKQLKRLVIITHPGAYFNSANLYFQFRGLIEQAFVQTGSPCTFLNVHAVYDKHRHVNNLESLFSVSSAASLIVPFSRKQILQAVEVQNLCLLMSRAVRDDLNGKFDVFDLIANLPDFLHSFSSIQRVIRLPRVCMFGLSYLGILASPYTLEVFLNTIIPMYKFRTEREFRISLQETKLPLLIRKLAVSAQHPFRYNAPLKSLTPF